MTDPADPIVPDINVDTDDVDANPDVTGVVTRDKYPVAMRNDAYKKFINDSCDLTDIAIDLGVPKKVVVGWARDGKWVKRKEELERTLMREADAKFVSFRAQHKLPEAKRQMELTTDLENLLAAVIKVQASKDPEDLNINDLKRLTEALEKATNVGARLVNITDDTSGPQVVATGPAGKQPLVVIGIGANPQVPIDVQSTDV
jgi:hypothetical protein